MSQHDDTSASDEAKVARVGLTLGAMIAAFLAVIAIVLLVVWLI